MIEFIFNKTSRVLRENYHLLIGNHEKALFIKVNADRNNYKHINFYAVNAEEQINEKLSTIEDYIDEISPLFNRLQQSSPADLETQGFISELSSVLLSLERKKKKLTRLKIQIPEGMLDVKRALCAVEHDLASHSPDEDTAIKHHFVALKDFMSHANKGYNHIIKQGGSIHFILLETTTHYWMTLREYKNRLHSLMNAIGQCSQLTTTGELARRCLEQAYRIIPPTDHALNLLDKIKKKSINLNQLMSQIGFSSANGRTTCAFLKRTGKPFFHMPHNENMYHIDYDPQSDLAETGGNCFGESLMFIHALSIGRFKRLCPEAGIINFQVDQTRQLPFMKNSIGQGETDVSADSIHQSLQWDDIKNVLIDNPRFRPGDLCGIWLSMNEYTTAQRCFTPRHIAVVAKLDVTQSLYKYIVFEKELGIFGLVDDESLKYIISQQIFAMYEGMNYSKIELTKYGEASPATYQFISKINPITEGVAAPQMSFFSRSLSTSGALELKENGSSAHL